MQLSHAPYVSGLAQRLIPPCFHLQLSMKVAAELAEVACAFAVAGAGGPRIFGVGGRHVPRLPLVMIWLDCWHPRWVCTSSPRSMMNTASVRWAMLYTNGWRSAS